MITTRTQKFPRLLAVFLAGLGLCCSNAGAAPIQSYGFEVVEKIAHPRENPYIFFEEYYEEGDEEEEEEDE